MRQRWRDLLFLHWAWPAEDITRTLPDGLRVDTFDGKAYLGVVPFVMQGVRPVGLPAVPGLSNFGELNLRTYVLGNDGTPGVWFYSLDAHQWLAVQLARKLFHLPYHRAFIRDDVSGDRHRYRWRRGWPKPPPTEPAFDYTAPPSASCAPAEPGTLAHFLVERYVLFSHHPERNRLLAGRVHHTPYRVAKPDVHRWTRELLRLNAFTPPDRPPDHALWSPGVDVRVSPLQRQSPDNPG
ncbi:MAG: DUF2071 domain-containing protein [Planctomycetota bacterium]